MKMSLNIWIACWLVASAVFPVSIALAGQTGSGTGPTPTVEIQSWEPQELLVKFHDEAPPSGKERIHRRNHSTLVKRFNRLNVDHIHIPEGRSLEVAMEDYEADPAVEYVEPNFRIYADGHKPVVPPSDPDFQKQWYLNNTGQSGGTAEADIDVLRAWKKSTGDERVIVAVIDSGVDYTHEDLKANMWVNRLEIPDNGLDDDQNGYVDDVYGIDTYGHTSNPDDTLGHGTHIAGVIGASGDNAVGVTGINWNVQILACRFLGPWGFGSVSGAVECLEYAKALYDRGENIVVTNNSWGFSGYSQLLYDVVSRQPEILLVAAAGNSGRDNDTVPYFPASLSLPNVIGVASTDHNDQKAPSSSFGRWSVHIGAPGVDIFSTLPAYTHWGASYYGYLSGTSMATPQVSGLAALLKADKKHRSWAEIRNLILAGGEPVSAIEEITITGARLNVYGSLICKHSRFFSPLNIPRSTVPGEAVTLSALNIECEDPGPSVRVETNDGELIELKDDGLWPDLAAHDGLFSAEWVPRGTVSTLRFFSLDGLEETVFLP